MAGRKSEQIKVGIVFVLALVLVIVVYVRFMKKKGPEATSEVAPPVSSASFDVPEVPLEKRENAGWRDVSAGDDGREPLRDIFVPPSAAAGRAGERAGPEESVSIASLKLRGVVAGGARPVALINDRFVRTGDWVYQYRVASIEAKEVWLDAGGQTFPLRILKDE